jgi:hypothetical protein
MTPKEKADELMQQMFSFSPTQESVELMLLTAKYCAIQAAKEIVFEYSIVMQKKRNKIKILARC